MDKKPVSNYVSESITAWVLFISRNARCVLILLFITTLVAAVLATKWFSLNSDNEQLFKPSQTLSWYEQNKVFNAAFPQLQNAALVVVSGRNLDDVNNTADALLSAFRQADGFVGVEASGREAFFTEHLLYQLDVNELTDLSLQLQQLLPLMIQLDKDSSLSMFFTLLQQSLIRDKASGELSDGSRMLLARLQEGMTPTATVNWFDNSNAQVSRDIYQIIIMQGRQQFDEGTPGKAVMEKISAIVAEHPPMDTATQVRVTGELAMANDELQSAFQGLQFASVASLVLLAMVLTYGVRSWTIVLAIFTLLLSGVVWTSLYASVVVGSFNTLSLVFLVMFFGLGVDFAIHFCLRVQEALSSPKELQFPLRSATQDLGSALLLCTITSGIAFLSFLPTDYRGLAELGVISAGGIAIAFLLTVTLLPAWFSVVGMPSARKESTRSAGHFGMDQFSPVVVLLLTALLSAGALWFAKDVHFDYSVLAMRDKSSEAMATLLEMQREQVSTDYSVSVLVPPDEVEELVQRLLALPVVAQVETPQTHIPEDQLEKQALLAPLLPYGKLQLIIPNTIDLDRTSAQQTALISQLAETMGFVTGDDLKILSSAREYLQTLNKPTEREQLQNVLLAPLFDQIRGLQKQLQARPYTLDDLPSVSRARLIAPDGRYRLDVLPREQLNDLDVMDHFVSEVEKVAPNIAGRTVVERGIGQLVVESFRLAIALALVGIFLVLLVYFRELLTPVLVLIPLGLTTLFTFAIIELSGLTLNMANILVVPLIFGLGVDTGIHVVHRYHVAGNVSELLRSSTPRAVTLSALTTIGTFISLSFNPHKGAASIGLILSVAISLLMVVTFVVLPALLAQFSPKPGISNQ